MTKLTTLVATLVAFGLSAPALAASQSSGQMESSQMQAQQQTQQNQLKHPQRIVIGKVVDVRGVQIKGPAGDKHRLIKLNAAGDTGNVVVDLGAMSKEAFQDLGINQGNRIWVLGSGARINGKPVIYARYVGEMLYGFTPSFQGSGQASFAAFETQELAVDEYGAYNPELVFLVQDEDWYGDWYGDVSDYWEDWEPWGYDDPGEAGLFDW